MAFWKKSEDPWDRKPGQRSAPIVSFDEVTKDKAEEENVPLGDKARAFFGVEKREPEAAPDPIPCPWCGKEMALRYLWGGQGVLLSKKKPGFWSSAPSSDNWNICDEGNGLTSQYKNAWYCADCDKLVVTFRPPKTPESRTQKEYEDELRRYAEQAKQREEDN